MVTPICGKSSQPLKINKNVYNLACAYKQKCL